MRTMRAISKRSTMQTGGRMVTSIMVQSVKHWGGCYGVPAGNLFHRQASAQAGAMTKVFDTHVHLPTKEFLIDSGGKLVEHGLKYFGTKDPVRDVQRMVRDFAEAGIDRALLLAWDAETASKRPPLSNDVVAGIAKEYPDLVVPVASVDPHKGQRAIEELERAASRLEMRGLKVHPQIQAFYPDADKWTSLWKKTEELGLPVVVHTGTSGLGAGVPGGDGVVLDYSRPIHLDAVAAKHPDLNIIAAHTGWPWHEELIAMCLHKTNVFMDLSGWVPKYIDPKVIQWANGPLKNQVLFGSDYPFLDPKRCLEGLRQLGWREGVLERILWENAASLFPTS